MDTAESFSQAFSNPRWIQVFFSFSQFHKIEVELEYLMADCIGSIEVLNALIVAAQADHNQVQLEQFQEAHGILFTTLLGYQDRIEQAWAEHKAVEERLGWSWDEVA